MNIGMSLSRFGLIAVALVAPPRFSLAQAQQQQPSPREDNLWGGKAHQPSEAEVLQREKDAGIARAAGNQRDVEQIYQNLKNESQAGEERADEEGNVQNGGDRGTGSGKALYTWWAPFHPSRLSYEAIHTRASS
jgi:hypothetical protein